MSPALINWLLFAVLSIIWGSSFILIKEGLAHLDPFQAASVRIISAGIVLLPLAIKYFVQIPAKKLPVVFLSGTLGSLLPAYLFCIAEQGLDSALAGTLNSLTPLFVIITGALFFRSKTPSSKILGIIIAFAGTALLSLNHSGSGDPGNMMNVFYIILATIMYGINVNMVQRHLHFIPSLHIVSVALVLNAIPAFFVLLASGYFPEGLEHSGMLRSTGYSFLLGVLGTAIASIVFYMLIKRAGAVFSSMVTYGIPIVANIWGLIYGEEIGVLQVFSLIVILTGVYLANRKASVNSPQAASFVRGDDQKI